MPRWFRVSRSHSLSGETCSRRDRITCFQGQAHLISGERERLLAPDGGQAVLLGVCREYGITIS